MSVVEHRKRLAASARRQQILDAAARLFIARGFEAVSMADLALELSISRPAVYSYFTSTEAVLDVLLTDRLRQLWDHLEQRLPPPGGSGLPPAPGVYAELFRFLTGERDSLLLLHSGGGPAFQARRTAFLGDLGRRLETQYPNASRPTYQMSIVTGLLDGMAYFAVQQGLSDPQELAYSLDAFMRGGVAALNREAPPRDGPAPGEHRG